MPLGLLLALKSAGGAIWRFLSNLSLWQAVALGLALFALLQHFQLADARHDRDAYKSQLAKIIEAQKVATERNKAEVKAKEEHSQRISDDTKSAYQRDLAKLRADNQRLRSNPKGGAHPAPAPEDSPAPEGADGDGLHLPPDQHLQAQEIELRLMHLQNWVEEQLKAQ